MTETESRQVRRARERAEVEPKRFFTIHPKGTRAQRAALRRKAPRNLARSHPTKDREGFSVRRIIAQRAMEMIFAVSAARRMHAAGTVPGDVGAVV